VDEAVLDTFGLRWMCPLDSLILRTGTAVSFVNRQEEWWRIEKRCPGWGNSTASISQQLPLLLDLSLSLSLSFLLFLNCFAPKLREAKCPVHMHRLFSLSLSLAHYLIPPRLFSHSRRITASKYMTAMATTPLCPPVHKNEIVFCSFFYFCWHRLGT